MKRAKKIMIGISAALIVGGIGIVGVKAKQDQEVNTYNKQIESNFETLENRIVGLDDLTLSKEELETNKAELENALNELKENESKYIYKEREVGDRQLKEVKASLDIEIGMISGAINKIEQEEQAKAEIEKAEQEQQAKEEEKAKEEEPTPPVEEEKPSEPEPTPPVEEEKPSEPKPQPPVEEEKPSEPKPTPPPVVETPKPVEPTPPPVQERTWTYMADLSSQTFTALNNFRSANGVAPLTYSSSEQSRANGQAEYNAKTETFAHDFLQISLGNYDGTAQAFINQWASSPDHKVNMLDEIMIEGAVSVYKDSNGVYYVVASFYDGW